jgi:hypothetical protein
MLKIYNVVLKDDDLGLEAVSFVDKPAIGSNFIFLNEHQQIYLSDDYKREVVSPLLVPDQLIYRRINDTELYIKYSAEVIKQLALNFVFEGKTNNVTLDHLNKINDVKLIELWISDRANDKSKIIYGYELPLGTLFVHYKILNDTLWE